MLKKIYAFVIVMQFTLLSGCGIKNNNADIASDVMTSPDVIISDTNENIELEYNRNNYLNCLYFNEFDFDMYESNTKKYTTDGEILCGVVPHHLIAGNMTAGFFECVSQSRDDVETVVIIAPIHNPENDKLCTTTCDWDTRYGILENEQIFSEMFIHELGASDDDRKLETDHSASSLIPFVKYYFPEATVSCLLIAGTASKDTPENVSKVLESMANQKKCLFVFSVDFSHYLEPIETDKHDDETLLAIMSNELEQISYMTNDNMDSPICIGTFLRLNKYLGGKTEMLDHSNSFKISELPYEYPSFREGVTSYFIFAGIK